MATSTDDTDGLIERARDGDPAAEAAILTGQRDRLRRMIATRSSASTVTSSNAVIVLIGAPSRQRFLAHALYRR